jgi:protein-L-isoaspartate(D-aspartate) O-methyltransferase
MPVAIDILGAGLTSQRSRDRLVQQLADLGIRNTAVLEAIRQVPRHLFVEEALVHRAYENIALPIGYKQTVSQPFIVARMTEALLEGGPVHTVLEVGTGSGYQAAVLAHLVDRVYSVERIRALSRSARELLTRLRINNVSLLHGDGAQGWPARAPFDGILLTAAPREVPHELLTQLAPGAGWSRRWKVSTGASSWCATRTPLRPSYAICSTRSVSCRCSRGRNIEDLRAALRPRDGVVASPPCHALPRGTFLRRVLLLSRTARCDAGAYGRGAASGALRLAALTTLFSVLGGVFGYIIGALAFELVSPWIIDTGHGDNLELAKEWFAVWGVWVVLIAGFSPIPYKLFTVTAGALAMPLLPFVIASLLGRGARFFAVGLLMAWLGPHADRHLRPYMERLGWLSVFLLAAAIIIFTLMD